jgi:hypothetical protein
MNHAAIDCQVEKGIVSLIVNYTLLGLIRERKIINKAVEGLILDLYNDM